DFLAGPGLAGDEHRQVRRGDERDVAAELLHRRAGTDQRSAVALPRVADELARDEPGLTVGLLERLDQAARPERLADEGSDEGEDAASARDERHRVERVGGERADELSLDAKRASEAGVDGEARRRIAEQETVEGVAEHRVDREHDRGIGAADRLETR